MEFETTNHSLHRDPEKGQRLRHLLPNGAALMPQKIARNAVAFVKSISRSKWKQFALVGAIATALAPSITTQAQNVPPGIEWQKNYSTNKFEQVVKTIPASGGGHIVLSRRANALRPSLVAVDTTDFRVWVYKVDDAGNIVWDKIYNSPGSDVPLDIVAVPNGGGYAILATISNKTWRAAGSPDLGDISEPDLNAGGSASNNSDLWVIRINESGSKMWDKRLGSSMLETAGGLVSTSDGGFLVLGTTNSTVANFDLTEAKPSNMLSSPWLVKISSNGTKQWDKIYKTASPNASTTTIFGLWKSPDGNYFIGCGFQFYSPGLDFTSPNNNTAGGDFKLLKVTPGGARIWDKSYGFTNSNTLPSEALIVVDAEALYIAVQNGRNNSVIPSGNRTAPEKGAGDIWMVKTNLDGDIIWDKSYSGSSGNNTFHSFVETNDNNLILSTNVSNGPIVYDRSEPTYGSTDAWLLKVNKTSGTRLWDKVLGGSSAESFLSLSQTNDNGIFAAITSVSGASGNMTTPNYGNTDNWLVRLDCVAKMETVVNTISPATQTICKFATPNVIVGNNLDSIYDDNIIYQWQSSPNGTTWTNIAIGVLKDYLAEPTGINMQYRRIAKWACDKADTSAVAIINVNSNTAPTLSMGGPYYSCPGQALVLGNTPIATGGTAPYSYVWDNASMLNNATLANPQATVNADAVFTVMVTDANSCKKMGQATVTIPPSNIAGADKAFCAGGAGVQIGTAPLSGMTGAIYTWSPATGLSATNVAQPIASPASTTTYTVTLTYTNSAGNPCTITDQVVVSTPAAPAANFAGADKTICSGGTTTIGTAAQAGYTYTWSPGLFLVNNNASIATFNPGSGFPLAVDPITYQVTADNGTCQFVDEVKVSVIKANAGIDGCGPRTIGYPDQTPDLNETYSWVKLGTSTGNSQITGPTNIPEPSITATTSGTDYYQVTVSLNGTTCTDVIMIEPCMVCTTDFLAEGGNCIMYKGSPLKLEADYGGIPGYTYSWSPAAGLSSTTGPVVYLLDGVNRTYTLTKTSITNPTDVCTATREVNNPSNSFPVFSAADVAGCNGTIATIGNNPVAGYTYSWTGPNGFASGVANPSVTVNSTNAGNYYVQVNDAVGSCFTRDTVVLTVDVPQATAGPDWTVCNNAIIQLGAASNNPAYTYSWTPTNANWHNGTNQNSQQPEVVIATTTTFTMTATSPNGCTVTDNAVVTATNTPTLVAAPDLIGCKGNRTTIGSLARTGVTYLWSPATGLDDPTLARPTVTVGERPTGAVYTVTATFPGGCTATDDVMVSYSDNPFSLGPDITYCPTNGAVSIGASAPTGANAYLWTPATGLSSSTVRNPSTSITEPTEYVLRVTYGTGANTCYNYDTINVTPAAPVNAGDDIMLCHGSSTTVGNASNTGTVSWTGTGAAYLNSTTVPVPVFNQSGTAPAGTYQLTLNRTVGTCTMSDIVVVTVNAPLALTPGSATICLNGTGTMGVAPTAGYTYHWLPTTGLSNPNASQTSVTSTVAGLHTYTLYATDQLSGCVSSASYTVNVLSTPAPTVTIPDVTQCLGGTVSLTPTVTPAGTYSYVWSPAVGLSNPFIANPTASIAQTTDYTLTVTSAANGCAGSGTTTVTVDQMTGDYISGQTENNQSCANSVVKIGVSAVLGNTYSYQWQQYSNATASWANVANGGIYSGATTDSLIINNNTTLNGVQFRAILTNTSSSCGTKDTSLAIPFVVDYCLKSSIGDYVWLDNDKNGTQGSTEQGVSGVTVTLYKNGVAVTSTKTDAYGKYLFTDLDALNEMGIANSYQVKFTAPANYSFSTQGNTNPITPSNPGSATDSDPNAGGLSPEIKLSYGQNLLSIDAGLVFNQPTALSSIGDRVWMDTDGNGTQDASESGIAGVTVTLYDAANNNVIMVTTTDANGNYMFNNLPNGNYTVGVTPLPGTKLTTSTGTTPANNSTNSDVNPSTGKTTTIAITAAGTVITGIDAGLTPDVKGSIGDRVWNDLDSDGIQDTNEPGVSGISMSLLKETSPGSGTYTVVATTTTDPNGIYLFNNLDAANYKVTATLPSGYTLSPVVAPGGTTTEYNNSDFTSVSGVPTSAVYNLNAGGKYMGVDMGIRSTTPATGIIGDRVWSDVNGNGIQDGGETGVAGVTVSLLDGSGNPYNNPATGKPYVVQTDANGNYAFVGLPNASYTVKFSNLPSNTVLSPTGAGTTSTDSDPNPNTGVTGVITLTAGNNQILTVDAGIVPMTPSGMASIGDKVWIDANNNGLQDAGEQGVGGVTVTLYAANGTTVIRTTQTDAQGNYIFDGLNAGSYVVGFSNLPARYNFVAANAGSNANDLTDSDALPATGKTGVIVLAEGEDNLSVDAGIYSSEGTNSIGDRIWLDTDADGVQDAGEQGLAGIVVNLIDANSGKVISSVVSDANGNYKFDNLVNGSYKVQVVAPNGLTIVGGSTDLNSNTNSDVDASGMTSVIALTGNKHYTTVDAGLTTTRAALGDYVWYDANGNGIQEAIETPVSGVTVTLYNSSNVAIASAITDAKGYYFFGNLNPGSYTVGFTTLPNGTTFTTQTVGTANGSDVNPATGRTNAVTLTAGQVNMDIDAGIKPNILGGVSGVVWNDVISDGIRFDSEPLIAGITVVLKNAAGTVIGTAITDGNGAYLFRNVTPGTGYTVTFSNIPVGSNYVTQTVGTNNGSDAHPSTGIISNITVVGGAITPYQDAGITNVTAPVPMDKLSFSGLASNCTVILNWINEDENQISDYSLEFSKDGRTFVPVYAAVAEGSGFNYSTSNTPGSATAFYRLKVSQTDGAQVYSDVLKFNLDCKEDNIIVYPNPASNLLYLNATEGYNGATAQLYNVIGQLVLSQELKSGLNSLSVDGLVDGTYNLAVTDQSGNTVKFKVVLQK